MPLTGRPALATAGGLLACALLVAACSAPAPAGSAPPAAPAGTPEPSGSPTSAALAPVRGRPPAATAPAGSFTIAATGDLLVHESVGARARALGRASGRVHDLRPMLGRVRPLVRAADLALCHVETPLSTDDSGIRYYPRFNAPPAVAEAYAWAGYEGCSTASNHALDMGPAGVASTLAVLDRAGLGHTGTARRPAEASAVRAYAVRGVEVAHLSYTFGLNGGERSEPWRVNLIDVQRVLADARRARAAGARFVVVSMHWGLEYRSAPTDEQQRQARAVLASPDVDLILGAHAHVQQPVERVGGEFVVYGMGNLLSNQSPARGLPAQTQDSAVVTVRVVPRGGRYVADRVTLTPTFCEVGTFTVWPVAATLANPATGADLRRKLQASLARTRAIHRGGAAVLAS